MRRERGVLGSRARAWSAFGSAVAMIVCTVMLTGCGREDGVAKSNETASQAQSNGPAEGAQAVVSPAAAVKAPLVGTEPTSGESLPPDIEVAPVDTLVSPGEPVDIIVRATSDVTRVALYDGSGERQALVRDPSGDVWRVTYRVPLRPQHERWGISITAKTDASRWRRVWVFLRVPEATNSVATKPDTTATTTP
jgi:hypothetical protein